jgi:hypothetical protein
MAYLPLKLDLAMDDLLVWLGRCRWYPATLASRNDRRPSLVILSEAKDQVRTVRPRLWQT